jgi:hypothetical protein
MATLFNLGLSQSTDSATPKTVWIDTALFRSDIDWNYAHFDRRDEGGHQRQVKRNL